MKREEKIRSQEELVSIVEALKSQGRTIVTDNGVFDIVHIGHVRSFEAAKARGEVLIVGVNSDASVRRIKGDKRPITPQMERMELLASLSIVDYVCLFEESEP